MEKTLFSRHIPKSNTNATVILHDIAVFNSAVHTAFVLNARDKEALLTSKDTGKPDLRLKENRELRDTTPPSTHMQLKEKYGINDYFANSANQAAKGVLRSVKELRIRDIKDTEKQISDVRDKLRRKQARLVQFDKTKRSLVALSKYNAAVAAGYPVGKKPKLRMPKGSVETYDKANGTFTIWRRNRKTGERKTVCFYDNAYLFETQYLDPQIKRLRNTIRLLENRISHLEASLEHLKKEPSVCFGSKDLFARQNTVYVDGHDAWKRVFRHRRASGMTISGRSDSKNGNYVFRYDEQKHELHYTAMDRTEVIIPDVAFPYGQEWLDAYVVRQREEKSSPIAWRIEDTGGSFLIKCSFNVEPDTRINDYYAGGCIGMDTNTNCLALAEIDSCGNLLSHKIVPFDLVGMSSEQAEHILSHALDEVFAYCAEKHKPLAMERLKDVANTDMYGSKKRNRKISAFAHTKITELALSKSQKYGITVTLVNPAYTSQIGKVKYMSRYGLAIHEAAAMAIARRGMGLKDRLPRQYIAKIPAKRIARHHWSHWQYLHKQFRELPPAVFYRKHNSFHVRPPDASAA